MCVGTASHVGKSVLCTALCRIFAQDGWAVAPFKSQNMSLNSAVTPDGREIGRAQAVQAAACRIPPNEHMNPVLLKPTGDSRSQVILQGRVHSTQTARQYFTGRKEALWDAVVQSYTFLNERYDVLVIEGAGSPVEMNLKSRDIANMRVAELADAAVLLVADISRGGIFASVLGTMELLDKSERPRVKGVIVNQFHGDSGLFSQGVQLLESYAGVPVLGVIPYVPALAIEEEDSLGLANLRYGRQTDRDGTVRIRVVHLPHMSNYTDFDPLFVEQGVDIAFCRDPEEIQGVHVVLLPGTKNTIDDLLWLKATGWEAALRRTSESGVRILGICGGFQMMGIEVLDPSGQESETKACAGLGLLPVSTVISPIKSTRLVEARLTGPCEGTAVSGYEIHMGVSRLVGDCTPFAHIREVPGTACRPDGAVSPDARVAGTYLHGLFDNDAFRGAWLECIRREHGLPRQTGVTNLSALRERAYDQIADVVRAQVRMDLVYKALSLPGKGKRDGTRDSP